MNSFNDLMIAKYGTPNPPINGWIYRPAGKNKKLIYNKGINDVEFAVCPRIGERTIIFTAYDIWNSMLTRAYSEKYHLKHPSYIDVIVCDEWHYFSKFLYWFNNVSNYEQGYHLDKDLLIENNNCYSPTSCIFIPQEVNKFLTLRTLDRGEYPLGVTFRGGKFQSRLNDGNSRIYLGDFYTALEAHKAWQIAKLNKAKEFNFRYLDRVISKLESDILNNIETTFL